MIVRNGLAVGASGGCIFNAGAASLFRSSFIENTAANNGGGISAHGNSTTSLTHVTVAGNTDPGTAAAIYHRTAGPSATVELVNTLITSGGATNCSYDTPFTSLGHNLEDLDTCGLGATGDLVNTTPLLGPLQDNGGDTHTMALLVGSPGLDDGDGTVGVWEDQRECHRPWDGDGDGVADVDIGAYEKVDLLFQDGFESGDTDRWSSANP